MNLTIEISDEVAARLDVLRYAADDISGVTSLGDVVQELVDHAQQGVYRPGAWERAWLEQAFGDRWQARLEPDDERVSADGRIVFDRPKAATS